MIYLILQNITQSYDANNDQVIEHWTILKFLKTINRILKPNGKLITTTP